MNPIQQTPGEAIKMCRARIAFVREAFRPRPLFRWLDEPTVAATTPRVRLPIFNRQGRTATQHRRQRTG